MAESLTPTKRILFLSSNGVRSGGSEELGARIALALARQGHRFALAKPILDHALRSPSRQRLSASTANIVVSASDPHQGVLGCGSSRRRPMW